MAKRSHLKKKKSQYKKLAKERINVLFNEAELSTDKSDRYVGLAYRLKTKYKVEFTKEQKRSFCKSCKRFLVPGRNCRVRLTNQKVVYTCLMCKHHTRIPYVQEIKEKRNQIV